MRRTLFVLVLLAAFNARVASPAEPSPEATLSTDRIVATLGKRETLLESGRYGLKYFPDECLALIQTSPRVRLLMAAGNSTSLLEGDDMHRLRLIGEVLKPGKPGTYDSGYAGIGAVVRDPRNGELLAFYHAEDHEGLPMIPGGIPGFYCCVALAVSHDHGATFHKLGPVITSSMAKDYHGRADQGCGEMCVLAEPQRKYLYAYYGDHSHIDRRGVQICLARCPLADIGAPGHWEKFFHGGFTQPGLGGQETPVLAPQATRTEALFPHVTYIAQLRRYVMVFNILGYEDLATETAPRQSGIYLASSPDGIHWSEATKLLAIRSIAQLGKEVGWHPTLVLSTVEHGSAEGWLYYSYSESWGHKPPQKPHYLVGHPLAFSLVAR